MKKICIVHYNTPYALTCLIKSINLHVNDAYIYVFENSDKELFVNTFDNVEIFDNSHGQILDYEALLKKYPNKKCGERNKWASFKHCLAIDKCFELINDNFVLLDSDVLVKNDFSELYQEDKICVGSYESKKHRIAPYLCFINVKLCKQYNIRYYNEKFMHGLGVSKQDDLFDTGYYFYKCLKEHEIKNIDINDYIIHYKGGSWEDTNRKVTCTLNEWVDFFKQYWEYIEKERYIVTLTSWPKRINNLPIVLDSILKQTILPYKICINLSIEEFPQKEKSIPSNVMDFIHEHNDIIEIHWLIHNTKTWKKIIPTLYRYPHDCIICIDDDLIYPNDFIETFVTKHQQEPLYPLSGVNYKLLEDNIQHCGTGSLDKLNFIQKSLETITKDVYNYGSTDTFYTYCYKDIKMKYVGKKFHTNLKGISNNDGYSKTHRINVKNAWQYCNKIPLNNNGKKIIEYICQNEYTIPIVIEGLNINQVKNYKEDKIMENLLNNYYITSSKKEQKEIVRTITNTRPYFKKKIDDKIINAIYDNI